MRILIAVCSCAFILGVGLFALAKLLALSDRRPGRSWLEERYRCPRSGVTLMITGAERIQLACGRNVCGGPYPDLCGDCQGPELLEDKT